MILKCPRGEKEAKAIQMSGKEENKGRRGAEQRGGSNDNSPKTKVCKPTVGWPKTSQSEYLKII